MRRLFIILMVLAVLPLYAKKKKKVVIPPTPPTQEERIGRDNARKYQYFYIEAVRKQASSDYPEAFDLLRHCLEIDSEAAEAHYSIARYYNAFGMDSLARYHYERAAAIEPENGEFLEQLGEYYLSHEEIDAATELYERVSQQYTDRTELLYVLLQIYEFRKDYNNLLKVLERVETAEGPSEKLTLSKMQVYSQLGNDEGAYNALESLCKAHPNDLNYQVMMGNWSLGHNRKEEAFETFKRVLEEEPDHAQAQMSLMDYYRNEGNAELADTMLYQMLENPKTEPKTRITLMRQVIKDNEEQGGDSTRILNIFRRILLLPQKTNEMALMQVAYMEYAKMPKDSIRNAIKTVLEITPEETSTRLKYIEMLWADSIGENVIAECKKAIDYSPKETALYYYLGLAQYLNEHDKDALVSFRSGIACKTDKTPTELIAKMFCMCGDILHQQNKLKEAYEAYDSCLVYNPEEITCLNNYAYFLSEEGKDLKRAEQMSYKAIKAEPRNGTYLDTYAWILYMQGRYEEANIYMEQAIKAFGEEEISETIIQHSKDIKAKLDKK